MLIDAHNHLQQFADADSIIREMREAGVIACVVNGTCEGDWPRVAELARRHPGFVFPAFGLHPWFAGGRSPRWLGTLSGYFDEFPQASLGECGVDQWVESPSITEQMEVFLTQLALARERNLPVTIHALRAWGPLLQALQQEPPPAGGFLLHSYGGSSELARQLMQLGAHFSFSGYFLLSRKAATLEMWRAIPPSRLMVETDAPDMLPPEKTISHPLPEGKNHPANLVGIARGLALARGEPEADLVRACTDGTRAFFRMC